MPLASFQTEAIAKLMLQLKILDEHCLKDYSQVYELLYVFIYIFIYFVQIHTKSYGRHKTLMLTNVTTTATNLQLAPVVWCTEITNAHVQWDIMARESWDNAVVSRDFYLGD